MAQSAGEAGERKTEQTRETGSPTLCVTKCVSVCTETGVYIQPCMCAWKDYLTDLLGAGPETQGVRRPEPLFDGTVL